MNQYSASLLSLSRKPSAFVPMAMSLIALALVLVDNLAFGVVRKADEGPTAHISGNKCLPVAAAGEGPVGARWCRTWPMRLGLVVRSGTESHPRMSYGLK